MKKICLLLIVSTLTAGLAGRAQTGLDYYLPEGARYNPAIPVPESVIGHSIGEYHLTFDRIVRYMEALAAASDRVTLVRIGQTHEKQQMIQLLITSPSNQANLEKIRKDHLSAIDPSGPASAVRKDHLVAWLGYSVHGNEPSGANASPLVAYYLAACEDPQVTGLLDQTVVILNPTLNPDGLNRFATYVNSRKSSINNPDINSIEFQEPWPGSRSNHYWFDLNRDWLLLRHPETQALVAQFHHWMPHLVTDHHEMGGNSTFFFQPGVQTRGNPFIPASNFTMTQLVGTYHAKALDQIGSLYYTEESFDDFYPGKGSTYPDIHGSIGILFEQAGSRGHLRSTTNGLMPFPFTIRNQVSVSLSSLEAAHSLRRELFFHMADFYRSALSEADASGIKGYLFGDPADPVKTNQMVDLLLKHQIEVQQVDKPIDISGVPYPAALSYYVPTRQKQYRLVRALFETVTTFNDSTFYDISTWTLPAAMGVPCMPIDQRYVARISAKTLQTVAETPPGVMEGNQSSVGYLIPTEPYLVHKALYQLLNAGIRVKIANAPFSMDINRKRVGFRQGTLFIPSQNQPETPVDLHFILTRLAAENSLAVLAAPTGYTLEGPDLGSGRFSDLALPKVLVPVGSGSSSLAGELWHLMDLGFQVPVTLADVRRFSGINLDQYNTLVLTSANYPDLDSGQLEKISTWVRNGGTLIALADGVQFAARNGLARLEPVEAAAQSRAREPALRPYAARGTDNTGRSIPGTIFMASLDTTHPLAYGYTRDRITLFRESTTIYKPGTDRYENPAVYTGDPLVSGYVSQENLGRLQNASALQRQTLGRGKVILFMDNPLFRGYWFTTHKLFLNALFWGKI
ncbi:MAG: M14 family metallopeptidase [Bacteroidales bacterium]